MNQDQRKFLIEQVNSNCKSQVEALENKIPTRPSLNNYLIASFLDNTIRFADIEVLKNNMREAVLKYGTEDVLVEEQDDEGYRYSRRSSKKSGKRLVKIEAEDLFIIPQAYKDELEKYEKEKSEIEEKIRQLNATCKTIIMKIQIGSSATMDKLVMQIDNMGDLDLVNTQLMLTA